MAKHSHGNKLADEVAQTPLTFTTTGLSSAHSPESQSIKSMESGTSMDEAGHPATLDSVMRTARECNLRVACACCAADAQRCVREVAEDYRHEDGRVLRHETCF